MDSNQNFTYIYRLCDLETVQEELWMNDKQTIEFVLTIGFVRHTQLI